MITCEELSARYKEDKEAMTERRGKALENLTKSVDEILTTKETLRGGSYKVYSSWIADVNKIYDIPSYLTLKDVAEDYHFRGFKTDLGFDRRGDYVEISGWA